MKKFLKSLMERLGYELVRHDKSVGMDPYCRINVGREKIVDLESLANISLSIPGMISPRAGQLLYILCYMQELEGDVVEIGSWQGRSTSFLARAVQNSKNGKFYAIDHFKGNIGKEENYEVGSGGMSGLKDSFNLNMERIGLVNSVSLLDMSNQDAEKEIRDSNIRFLFIDGDHTEEGVKKDLELFLPKLMKGSIIVFDDFSQGFSGLVKAVDELMMEREFSRVMSYKNTLVLVC